MTQSATENQSRAGGDSSPLLSVRDLQAHIFTSKAVVKAVDGVSFDVHRGHTLGLVGESGSGKSMTCLTLLQLLPPGGRIVRGAAIYKGEDLTKKSGGRMRRVRGREIALIPQDPLTALNPVHSVETQVAAPLRAHGLNKGKLRERVIELLGMVGLPSPEEQLSRYPHQLSGGMRQRVVGAIALAAKPSLLLADEPTTSLDPTIQLQFLDLLKQLRDELHLGIIFVTHDLGIIARICDDVAVMYAGRIVEYGPTATVLKQPLHPYTQGLISSIPDLKAQGERLDTIPGRPPRPGEEIAGCRFAPRCSHVMDKCRETYPSDFGSTKHHGACWLLEGEQVVTG